jgi:putative membrane protein
VKALFVVFGIVGLALATALIVRQGADVVVAAVLAAGWGLIAVVAVEALPLTIDSLAWRLMIPAGSRPRPGVMVWARWIRTSVSQLLPVAQVGGDAIGARMLHLRGVPGQLAGAATVVDLTLAAATQLLYTLAGLALLWAHTGDDGLATDVLAGSGLLLLGLGGFVIAQRNGLFRFLARRLHAVSGGFVALVGDAERLDQAVRAVYRRPGDMARNAALQLFAWVAGTLEVWLALTFIGHPVSLAEAYILQSLSRAVRSAAFVVPGGLGIQEGGLMVLAGVLGLSPEIGLALALIKRVRELAFGVPGLIAWQAAEGHRLLRRRRPAVAAPEEAA